MQAIDVNKGLWYGFRFFHRLVERVVTGKIEFDTQQIMLLYCTYS